MVMKVGHIINGKLKPLIPMPSLGQVSLAVTSLSEQCAIKRLSQTRAVGPPSWHDATHPKDRDCGIS